MLKLEHPTTILTATLQFKFPVSLTCITGLYYHCLVLLKHCLEIPSYFGNSSHANRVRGGEEVKHSLLALDNLFYWGGNHPICYLLTVSNKVLKNYLPRDPKAKITLIFYGQCHYKHIYTSLVCSITNTNDKVIRPSYILFSTAL